MLTSKAKQFLKKYKDGGVPTYQLGAITPTSSMYQVADPYDLPMDTTEFNMGQNIHNETPVPFLSTPITPVQQVNPLGTNMDMSSYKAPPASKQNPLKGLDMGMFSPLVNIGIGVSELIKSGKRKREQKEYEKLFNADLERRQEEARTQGYYYTPYMQQGGNFMKEVDQFMTYYTNQEAQEKNTQQQFEDLYTEENNRRLAEWKAQKASGIGNLVSGAAGVATKLLSPVPTMKGGGIHINPENKGKFTAKANKQHLDVQAFAKKVLANKDKYDPKTVQQANFAANAAKWKHEDGGDFQVMGITDPNFVMAAISGNKIDRTMQDGGNLLEDVLTQMPKRDTLTYSLAKKNEVNYREKDFEGEFDVSRMTDIDAEYIKRRALGGGESNKVKSPVRFREKEDGGYVEVPDWSMPVRFQQGGEVDPELDLYSPEFNPNKFLGKEELIRPEIEQEQQAIESQETVSNWLFGDDNDDPYRELLTDAYSQGVDFSYTSPSDAPISNVVSQLEAMGIKPSSVTGGQHNVGSKHYEGKALDLGINTSFGGDAKKMDEFYQYLQSPQGKQKFPNVKVIDERVRPAGQKVWSGQHLHLEIE